MISFFFGKTFSGLVLMTLLFLESKEKFKTEMEIYKKKIKCLTVEIQKAILKFFFTIFYDIHSSVHAMHFEKSRFCCCGKPLHKIQLSEKFERFSRQITNK